MNEIAKGLFGMTRQAKTELLARLIVRTGEGGSDGRPADGGRSGLADLPGFAEMKLLQDGAKKFGIANPYFHPQQGIAGATTVIEDRVRVNFASYNYLGLNGHPAVSAAANAAIEAYGTSVSASRLVAGERPLHRALEDALASFHRTEACLALVSGYTTNVSLLGHLMGGRDLIVHDTLIHNSLFQGALLAKAHRAPFAHNDPDACGRALADKRKHHRRAMIVIEGLYSMDGDLPDLPAFIALARRYDAWLYLDEAHSLGVLGERGAGLAEHWGVDPAAVDIRMGTLSKTLASCGGYVTGRSELIEYLRYTLPGFVYSVGMAPPQTAAALAALTVLREEPERVAALRRNGAYLLGRLRDLGLDTGGAVGAAVVPLITGSSAIAARLSERLLARGFNVPPILFPAVPEGSARLRFFLTSGHTADQIDGVVAAVAAEMGRQVATGGPE